jgi:hypothetical protein
MDTNDRKGIHEMARIDEKVPQVFAASCQFVVNLFSPELVSRIHRQLRT